MNKENFKLKSVGIEITWNCNKRCSYCYLACSNQKNTSQNEMSVSTFKQIIEKIWTSGVREVYLIGGEPTVHSDFSQLVKIMNGYKWEKTGICTNGVGISSANQKLIKQVFDYVSVSIRGNSDTTTKVTSVQTSFQETINFLKFLSENKTNQIIISLDLLPQYFTQFNEIIDLLEQNNIKFDNLAIHRIAPIGSASDKDVLTPDQYRKLLKKIDIVSTKKGYQIEFEDALPLCLLEKKYWKYINTCRCGIDKVWVDTKGNVRRCACSYGNVGNVIKTSLQNVWNSDNLKKFRSFDWVSPECKKCGVFDKCRGGCASSKGVEFFDLDRFSDYFKAL